MAEDATLMLLKMALYPDERVRSHVVSELRRLADMPRSFHDEGLRVLIELAESDPSEQVRAEAAEAVRHLHERLDR
jgi:hypothetical protein